jgi:hypothetical protein
MAYKQKGFPMQATSALKKFNLPPKTKKDFDPTARKNSDEEIGNYTSFEIEKIERGVRNEDGEEITPSEKTPSPSSFQHAANKTHVHGPGYLPPEALKERSEFRQTLIDQGIQEGSDQMKKALIEWTQNYKENNPHPTMPTNEDIAVMKEKGSVSEGLGKEGLEIEEL